ncbi:xaa-Pro dipeptidase [Liquorilactobacillus sucicola DSM 21376 = JCM 15457]|uniref:Xaa-Pro dipeptidase n=1 Tax=Liquorilactobacillus sucicola DSM 21376 = JCM 15457 TaxID=1423806 RepID=A0A0R2DU67_9LACO|nr:Xaa-Pro peptidase family protein [Liquorilactobacillus sucicola]KRN05349.1 xaa-Pro dipeptidase [Liquorilactobacillus sucicola DSM 21376 = JCM 15457]
MRAERITKLLALLEQMSLDSFLVTNPINIFYLSGFTGDAGVLLLTNEERYLITDSRFEQQVQEELTGWKIKISRDYIGTACKLAEQLGLVALGFEDTLTYRQYDYLDETAVCDIVPLENVIESLRSVKEPAEIQIIREAAALAGRCYRSFLEVIKPGCTEIELANWVDNYMKKNGASESSFATIVAAGERTAWPHAVASSQRVNQNDLVTLDFGYYYQGYTSDVTRTFALGAQSDDVKKMYDVVLQAQQRTIAAVRAGATGQELDEIGRSYIESKGFGAFFNHGMGHGIGLDIHELPNIGQGFATELQAGQVITIEPGIYVPGTGGVRIEDDILVTENGFEILTDFQRSYREIRG